MPRKTYMDVLKEEGIPNPRAGNLTRAIDILHSAVCRLDNQNLKIFFSKPLSLRLREYAKIEGIWVPPTYHSWRI